MCSPVDRSHICSIDAAVTTPNWLSKFHIDDCKWDECGKNIGGQFHSQVASLQFQTSVYFFNTIKSVLRNTHNCRWNNVNVVASHRSKKKWNKRSQQYLYVKYAYVVSDTNWMYVFTSNRPTRSPQCRQKRKPNNSGSNCEKKYDHINLTFHFWLATFCNSATLAVGKSAIQRVNNMNKKKKKFRNSVLGSGKSGHTTRVCARGKKTLSILLT